MLTNKSNLQFDIKICNIYNIFLFPKLTASNLVSYFT